MHVLCISHVFIILHIREIRFNITSYMNIFQLVKKTLDIHVEDVFVNQVQILIYQTLIIHVLFTTK